MSQRSIVTILGKTGSGKSTLIFKTLVPALPAPVFVLDTMNDVPYGLHFGSCPELIEFVVDGRKNGSGVYVLNSESDSDSEMFFRMSYSMGARHTIVVDEVDKFAGTRSMDEYLNRIIRYGRRREISCIFAARRPSEISPTIRAQSDLLVSFVQTEPVDIKAMRERSELADKLPELKTYRETGKPSEYIVMGDGFYIEPYSSILVYDSISQKPTEAG